jgi:glutamate-1-semialdehyde 2,1-aminomutase
MAWLEKEVQRYVQRTPKSKRAHREAMEDLPLGVATNLRAHEPYPLFVESAMGAQLWDLDGNEYLDFNLSCGALITGHSHPAIVKAIGERLQRGTMFGMPTELAAQLAHEIKLRFPVDQVRFATTGTEAAMHAIRLARGVTGREKIIKMEGAYHGAHDAVLVSVKPPLEAAGDARQPKPVASGHGIPKSAVAGTLIAPFNDLVAVERLFREHRGEVAAVIVEPIMMNLAMCMPAPGYLRGLRELTQRFDALLIFDEVKAGVKLARGGACEFFGVEPDIIVLGEAIGGGFPLAAFGARKRVMDAIASGKVFHAGTHNAHPVAMTAGLVALRDVLTPQAHARVAKLNEKLLDGYRRIARDAGLHAIVEGAGANGAILFLSRRIRNYRDWLEVDTDLWQHYWFGMVNRGVLPQPYWWDEQWTISVAHTEQDIEKHLDAFADLAPALAEHAQQRQLPL